MDYVWYAGYGSNLHEQRFMCYINGGIPKFGSVICEGCTQKANHVDSKKLVIPHAIYFALPDGIESTKNWGPGGVAFVDPKEDTTTKTLCRMWKIAAGQFEEVVRLEGCGWYDKKMQLGVDGGIPIYTITHSTILSRVIRPSGTYIKTIALGLMETYGFTKDDVVAYLMNKKGVLGVLKRDALVELINHIEIV